MTQEFEKAIDKFLEIDTSKGIYLSQMIKYFGVNKFVEMINILLNSIEYEKFEKTFELTCYIFNNLAFIPGNLDNKVVDKIIQDKIMDSVYKKYMQLNSYCHIVCFIKDIDALNESGVVINIDSLLPTLMSKNPFAIVELFNHFISSSLVFPIYEYNNIQFDNEIIKFIIKYNIATSWKNDPFTREELLNGLIKDCPPKYISTLERKIQTNSYNLIDKDTNDIEDDSEDHLNIDNEQNEIERLFLGYFEYSIDKFNCGKLANVEDYLLQNNNNNN